MAKGGGGAIFECERTVMLTIIIPSIPSQMDVIAALQLRMDELCYQSAKWAQEANRERFCAEGGHLLVRCCTGKVMGNETLGEMGVENNECFYLF